MVTIRIQTPNSKSESVTTDKNGNVLTKTETKRINEGPMVISAEGLTVADVVAIMRAANEGKVTTTLMFGVDHVDVNMN